MSEAACLAEVRKWHGDCLFPYGESVGDSGTDQKVGAHVAHMMKNTHHRSGTPGGDGRRASPSPSRAGGKTGRGSGEHKDGGDSLRELDSWDRRALNVTAASLSLVLALPILVIAALAVKLSSPGPAIYSQERVGLERRRREGDRRHGRGGPDRRGRNAGGKVFRMYKLRTMYVNGNGEREKQQWATKDDPRITSVGRVLRAFRWDELPQMVNVLLGDMNLVGPRPEQPEIFRELRQEFAEYPKRQRVLPGITGLAQVHRGYDRCVEDVRHKLSLDLHYIERNSPSEDVKIMLRTIPVILFRKGVFQDRERDNTGIERSARWKRKWGGWKHRSRSGMRR